MGIAEWYEVLRQHRRTLALAGLFLAVAGLNFLLFPSHDSMLRLLGLPLLIAGIMLSLWASLSSRALRSGESQSMAARLIGRITVEGRLAPFLPTIGAGMVVLDLGYNIFLSTTPELLTEDVIVLLLGATLIAYPLLPADYSKERDFVLLFFVVLFMLLVAPLLLGRLATRDLDTSVDAYSWVALAPEVSAILTLLGVTNTVHAVPGLTAPGLSFVPIQLNFEVTVAITTACSGIYSFGIFASAFVSFVLSEYSRVTRRIWGLLVLGFITSYAANLLRMVTIILVGYYSDSPETDLQNMLIAHSYLGWAIFLAWIALFWGVLIWRSPHAHAEPLAKTSPRPAHHAARCLICLGDLTPSAPALRCSCGALYHSECIRENLTCPSCGRMSPTSPGVRPNDCP